MADEPIVPKLSEVLAACESASVDLDLLEHLDDRISELIEQRREVFRRLQLARLLKG